LKGRYFHDTDFLGSSRKKHASHTWRAILAAKEVLSKGMIKRIGDGNMTNIWRDRWIPMHFDARPLTPGDGQMVTMVSDLLTESRDWNEELIREIFIPVDANAILRTPMRLQEEDWWAWELEKYGEYSVRSTYRKLANDQMQGELLQPQGSGDISWQRT
jgi:hypothetical protein